MHTLLQQAKAKPNCAVWSRKNGTCVPVLRFWIETGSPGAPVLSRRTLELGVLVSDTGKGRVFQEEGAQRSGFEGLGALLELGQPSQE